MLIGLESTHLRGYHILNAQRSCLQRSIIELAAVFETFLIEFSEPVVTGRQQLLFFL